MPSKPSKLSIISLCEVQKGLTQDKKATTQDEKDILGTKRTKQGHSGQKGRKGTFLALSFLKDLSRVDSCEGGYRASFNISMNYEPFTI